MLTTRHSFVANLTSQPKIAGAPDISIPLTRFAIERLSGKLKKFHVDELEANGWEQTICFSHEAVTSFWEKKGSIVTVRTAIAVNYKPILTVAYYDPYLNRNIHHARTIWWRNFEKKLLKYFVQVETQLPD